VAVVDVLGDGVELVLGDARRGRAHRLHQGEARQARGPADQLYLARALDEPRLVERGRQVAHLELREARAQHLDQPPLA
jgi:hypothetical protein